MTDRVDQILTAKHEFDGDLLGQLDADDLNYAQDVATGATQGPEPLRALELLALGDSARANDTARQILSDTGASEIMRAGAARIAAATATGGDVAGIINDAAASASSTIQSSMLQGVMRTGDANAIQALQSASGSIIGGAAADQLPFALSVIAQRIGATDFPLPVPDASQLLAAPSDGAEAITVNDADQSVFDAVSALPVAELFGVNLAQDAARSLECADETFLLAVDSGQLQDLATNIVAAPNVLGLVAHSDPDSEGVSIQWLLMSWPDDAGGAYVALHRLDGRQDYFGPATITDGAVQVTLATVSGPGAAPVAITVASSAGSLDFQTAQSGTTAGAVSGTEKDQPDTDPDSNVA